MSDPTRPHKVFLLNAGGLDVDTFLDIAFEDTKRCLGDLFHIWPAAGWPGGGDEFERAFREGAASANGECLIAAFASAAEAQRLVDELHTRLWPDLAITREVQAEPDDLPPAGGARDYAVTIRVELVAEHAGVTCDRSGTR
jgi:hypothetical protein